MSHLRIRCDTGSSVQLVPQTGDLGAPLARQVAKPGQMASGPSLSQSAAHRAVTTDPSTTVGIIVNRRAHRNMRYAPAAGEITQTLDWAYPQTEQDLREALARFASRKIDILVVDGGDGTIRDVLSIASAYFRGGLPKIAIIPSGKTNALALDLGIPIHWSLDDALAAAASGRTKLRSPIEIRHAAAATPHLRGFLFGAGAFVEATAIAQDVHGIGGYRGVAVGLSLAAAIAQTVFGGRDNRWRRGIDVRVTLKNEVPVEQPFYLILGSTLKRLPLGLRPFGRERAGLKILGIDAPPRHVLATLPALLTGSEAPWLERFGYHRRATDTVRLQFKSGFVLDGETYPGGDLILHQGDPLEFVVP